ncbi:MAG: hypothetical protein FWD15_04740 [Alphaproteobacteria bacterium]|nr:hypothetical protein [Alphaproteobacteria bacterium]
MKTNNATNIAQEAALLAQLEKAYLVLRSYRAEIRKQPTNLSVKDALARAEEEIKDFLVKNPKYNSLERLVYTEEAYNQANKKYQDLLAQYAAVIENSDAIKCVSYNSKTGEGDYDALSPFTHKRFDDWKREDVVQGVALNEYTKPGLVLTVAEATEDSGVQRVRVCEDVIRYDNLVEDDYRCIEVDSEFRADIAQIITRTYQEQQAAKYNSERKMTITKAEEAAYDYAKYIGKPVDLIGRGKESR